MDSRAREVLRIGDKMFSNKEAFDSLCQEIALNFYPERADFTTDRSEGEEFSDHLFSSYPAMARRELANLFASNMRRRTSKWFTIHVQDENLNVEREGRAFLERLTDIQWRAMYDHGTQFVRSTKEADHDFAAFGNAVIKAGLNIAGNGLLFTAYHLRDNAWAENAERNIDCNHRNWKPTARQLIHHFPETASTEVRKAFEKDPEKTFKCRHVVMPSRLYPYKNKQGKSFPFVSLYVERDSETVLEETGLNYFCYVIPRWQTIAGSPYGRSMATSVVLPDGRTMQVMVRVLREAGEKYVDPPMLMVGDAIRSDLALYPGGVTNVDHEYDERLGEVLRPVSQDHRAMPIGFELAAAIREDIRHGFFLDKIQLPETNTDMTAYEVRRRLEQHISQASPLFEPIEQEYNSPLCELAFNVLREGGAFSRAFREMPAELQGQGLKFAFRSPTADMADQAQAEIFLEGMERIWAPAAQFDPAQLANVNWTEATRDASRAIGWKATWLNDVSEVAKKKAEMEKQAEMEAGMQAVDAAAGALDKGGKGIKALTGSG